MSGAEKTNGYTRASSQEGQLLLAGVRVLDFSRFIAGPYCGSILSDLGAEVIRVETIGGGEDRLLAPVTCKGEGALFLQLNRNKKSLTLNFRSPQSWDIIQALVKSADIVISNMPPSTLKRSRLDYDSLSAVKADIITTNITGFGDKGPLKDHAGFDAVGQAMSGAAYLGGTAGRPSRSVSSYVDYSTGLAGALGTLAALMHRDKTGRGQAVNASLFASALTLINAAHIEATAFGRDRAPVDNRSPNSAPSDFIATRDGTIVVQVVGNAMFKRFAHAIGRAELVEEPRFASDALRGDNGVEMSAIVSEWAAARSTQEALDLLVSAGIPAGPVRTPKEVADDPDTWAADVFTQATHPDIETPLPIANLLVQLSAFPQQQDMTFPPVGGNTRDILRSVGYSREEIDQLIAGKIVGEAP